jgi:hypothetical protein
MKEAAAEGRWTGITGSKSRVLIVGARDVSLLAGGGGFFMVETMNRLKQESGSEEAQEHSEGVVARTIEQQTAKMPSDVFLWAAFASIGGSLFLHISGKKDESLFVGQWAPTFLILGLYNKLVKIAGSDRT